ncbi:MAG: DUF4097 domain-containing protein [Rhodothermales bacterium]
MTLKIHTRKTQVHARTSHKVLLHTVPFLIVALLFLNGCDTVEPMDEDDVDIWTLNDDYVASASFSYEVAVAQHTRIRLDAVNGPVEIHGDPDATSVRIAGKRRVGSESMQDAERHLEDLEVRVEDHTDEVFIKTVQPQQFQGRTYLVDYTITLPEHLDVDVDQINGDIKVRNVTGSVWVALANGVIDCFATLPPTRLVDLALGNGDIKLGIPTSTSAEFSARVTNGHISTSNLILEGLVRSPRSLIGRLGDGEGTIELKAVNGNIHVAGHE